MEEQREGGKGGPELEEETRRALEAVFGESSEDDDDGGGEAKQVADPLSFPSSDASTRHHGQEEGSWEPVEGIGGLWLCRQFLSLERQEGLLGAIEKDKSAGERSSKYWDLLLAVKKSGYFESDAAEPELPPPPSAKRLISERSPVQAAIAEAKKASTLKKMKYAPELQTPLQGPAILSFEEFASQRAEPSTPDTTPSSGEIAESEFAQPILPSTLSFEGPMAPTSEQAVAITTTDITPGGKVAVSISTALTSVADVSAERESIVSFTIPPSLPPVVARTSTKAPFRRGVKPLQILHTGSCAVGGLGLEQLHHGSSSVEGSEASRPFLELSESSSKAGDTSLKDSFDGNSHKAESHSMEMLMGENTSKANNEDSCPSGATLPCDVRVFRASELPLVEVQGSTPLSNLHPSLPQLRCPLASQELGDVSAPPLPQLTYAATCTVEASTEQMIPPSAATSAINLVNAPAASCTDSVLIVTAVPSSCEVMAADLWSEVDNQVTFQIPTTAPSAGTFPSDVPVKQNLTTLLSMVACDPRLIYSSLMATAEKITEVLVFMGCPLENWFRRVTLLLKLVKRQEFLANELPSRLAAVETRRSEQELVFQPLEGEVAHLRTVLDNSNAELVTLENKVAQLKTELATAEAKLQELTTSRAQQAEAISSAESKATSATLALKELQAQRESLEAMSTFPFVGILPLEEIFKDL